jgi:3',5'-cyclic AMP phosphodiesterase CpdA
MLIAQITDVHIGFEPDNPDEFNRKRLDAVLDTLIHGPNRPDLLIATGDITDRGDADSYRRLGNALSRCPFPVWPSVGNHDLRDNFSAQFPGLRDENGFIQYVVDLPELRLITIDTLEEGRHGGAFCDARARWLSDRLGEAPDRPTYIIMHHPPVEVGLEWMNTDHREPWVARFAGAIADHRQLRGLICGHLHRSITASWNGLTISICSSTAPQVALDLRPIDPELPDNRPMIVAEDPAFALHRWNGRELVSFYDDAGAHTMLAKYDAKLQPLVRELRAERPVQ